MTLAPYKELCSLKCQASRKISKLTVVFDSVLRPLCHIDTSISCKSVSYGLYNYAVAIKRWKKIALFILIMKYIDLIPICHLIELALN